jgi:hypothetical protein
MGFDGRAMEIYGHSGRIDGKYLESLSFRRGRQPPCAPGKTCG